MSIQRTRYWIIVYSTSAVILFAIYHLLDLKILDPWRTYIPFLKKLSMSFFFISLIFLLSKIISRIITSQTHTEGDRYNLIRITRFLAMVSSLIVLVSFLFQNLYAAVVSFGLISLILGFALQNPITSFIAWIYLIFRRSYLVGDRIQLKNMRGDVIEISYLDTTILECSGDYLENDRRSGRIIRFPNSLILREEIINYSGPQTPFIWNETAVQIAYTSDLQFVENCLLKAAQSDFMKRYPLLNNGEHSHWKPAVYFRNSRYAWMEAVISYPVEPKDTTERRNRILHLALPQLNSHPDKVQFPEGTLR